VSAAQSYVIHRSRTPSVSRRHQARDDSMTAQSKLKVTTCVTMFAALCMLFPNRASGQQAKDILSWSGCYVLEFGTWSRPAVAPELPTHIRLDTVRFVFSEAFVKTWNGVLSPRGRAEHASWYPVSADTARLSWSNEFRGISVRLVRDDSLFKGVASGSLDEHLSPAPTASIKARRIECSTTKR
jgi:hypothetical protein